MIVDAAGNLHAAAGTVEGGRFAGKVATAPTGSLSYEPDDDVESDVAVRSVYTIPPGNLQAFLHKVELANRKLARAGIAERFELSTERRIIHSPDGAMMREVVDVTVNTPSISFAGWRYRSVTTRAANGQLLTFGGGQAASELACDYCGHTRARSKIINLQNEETGEWAHIGTNCLKLFLGVRPEGLWSLTEDFAASELTDDDKDWSPGSMDSRVYDATALLAFTIAVADANGGFISAARATREKPATADAVTRLLENHAELPPGTTERAAEVLAWIDQLDDSSDYQQTLRSLFTPDPDGNRVIGRKHIRLAASAVGSQAASAARELRAREARNVAEAAVKSYLAPAGTALKGLGVRARVVSVRQGVDYGYGAPDHVTLLDQNGHTLYWKASAGALPAGLVEGAQVELTSGTVKENRVSDFNGVWETVLTRLKATVLTDAAAD